MRDGNSRRVLIIEDDDAIRSLIVQVLTDAGYDTRSAANGHRALDILTAWSPDLILLNMLLPDMSGRQFLAAQRTCASLRTIPVLVQSVSRQGCQEATDLGVAAVIESPFDLDVLLAEVKRRAS